MDSMKNSYELFTHSDKILNLLTDENKINRRNALKSIHSQFMELKKVIETEELEIGAGDGHSYNSVELLREGFDIYINVLMNLIGDPVEKTRELSYELLRIYVEIPSVSKETLNNSILPQLIPLMVQRLGQPELNEPSEEVRLLAIQLLSSILEKMESKLNPYIDDYQQILSSTIIDPFHTVRIQSCDLTIRLAQVCKDVFHYNSDRLIKPLCKASSHQQWRVRLAVVECIGVVILIGNYKAMEVVIPFVTQRLLDSSQIVRKAVIQVVGSWMLDYIDRYSYFHKLLPLILIGLVDESDEICEVTSVLWDKIGTKYLEENIDEYKDEADFPSPAPDNYPADLKRPNLGCRIITWQNTIKILPAIGNEVVDWQLHTRLKSAQLLYTIILNTESRITMHIEKILHFMFKACTDEEPIVSNYILKSAELLGYFVPLSASWPILSSSIVSYTGSEGPLAVFSSMLRGIPGSEIQPYIMEILSLLADDDICQTTKAKRQIRILEICEGLMNIVPGLISNGGMEYTFRILVSVLSLSTQQKQIELSKSLLEKLAKISNLKCLDDLMGQESGKLLQKIKPTSSVWTSVSTDKLIFETIFAFGGKGIENNMDIALEIMSSSMSPDKDPDVRLKFFTMLGRQLENNYSDVSHRQKEQLQSFVKHIVEDVLDPNLVWKAGKTAGALRTAAASCLLSILNGNILKADVLSELGPKIVHSMIGLVEDSSETTRLIVCRAMSQVVENADPKLKPEVLHKIYPVMLKRLDDVSNNVRTQACYTIGKVFTNVPPDYDTKFYKGNIHHAISTLLVHLDDSDESFQNVVSYVLYEVGSLQPELLVEECEKVKMKHNSPVRCDELIYSFQEKLSLS